MPRDFRFKCIWCHVEFKKQKIVVNVRKNVIAFFSIVVYCRIVNI